MFDYIFPCRDKFFSADANLNIMLFCGYSEFSVEKELKYPSIYAVFHDFMAVAFKQSGTTVMEFVCLVSSLISNNLNRFHTSTPHSIAVYDEVNPTEIPNSI